MNKTVNDIKKRIAIFEHRYEITSDEMLKKWKQKELKDTAEISEWLMLLKIIRQIKDE